jgi:uncharacterized membrane protein
VRLVAAGNVLWVIASALLLVSGRVHPTPSGTGFVLLQAAVVVVFAYLENRAAGTQRPARGRLDGGTSLFSRM